MVDRYRHYQPKKQPRRKSRRGFYTLILLAVVIFGGRAVWGKIHSTNNNSSGSPSASKTKPKVKAEIISSTTWQDLSQKVSALLGQNPGLNLSVSVIDINSDTKGNYGIQEAFHGASTTKVLTAAAYLHDVETNKRSLTENLGGGSAETHIRRMINRSDNNSWAVLNSAVGYGRLDSYAQTNSISSYKYIGNLMAASDQALLLQKLYKKELLNEAHTKLLLSFMQNTNNEDMIPAGLPQGVTVYHKYGQLDDRLHDTAIIDHKKKPIVLTIYSKGTSDGNLYSARTQLIQQITKTVFDTVYADL